MSTTDTRTGRQKYTQLAQSSYNFTPQGGGNLTSGNSAKTSGAMSGAATGAMIGSAFGPVGTVAGGIIGGVAGYFGSKRNPKPKMVAPNFIDVQTVDLPEGTAPLGYTTRENIKDNLENLPLAQQLVTQADAYEQDRLLGLTEKAMPGFREYQKKLTEAGMERLNDPYSLPADQQEYLRRKAAESGITRGTRGEFNSFDLMRDFGISSMQYGSQRLQESQSIFQQLNATMPRVNPTSPLNFLTTAGQAQQQAQFDANYEFNAAQFDFQQNLIRRNAAQKQADIVANIQNANARGKYEAIARQNAEFNANMQQLGTSLAGGFSGGGGGGFSSGQISSEMNRAGTWSGQQRAMGNKGLSAADYADMYDSMSAWKSGSSTGR
jgi:hypothetical protein